MWGHYADAEKGFVIAYASDDNSILVNSPINILSGTRPAPNRSSTKHENEIPTFVVGFYKEERLNLERICYRKKLPKANAFFRLIPKFSYSERDDYHDVPLTLPADANEKEDHKVGLIKYSDWRYEQEIRAFLPVHETTPPDARVLRVSTQQIRGLIFGPKMKKTDRERAILCCHLMRETFPLLPGEKQTLFAFFEATHANDLFELQIRPVGVLSGIFYRGDLPFKEMAKIGKGDQKNLLKMAEHIEATN